jgi:hypothetical protein
VCEQPGQCQIECITPDQCIPIDKILKEKDGVLAHENPNGEYVSVRTANMSAAPKAAAPLKP